ncbi:MAG: hypothetical protein KAJ14_10560 [Candidatus Omnitrophica bacterium]|nr:hypothetical protein [Candidatus Omnitrophota bacterium]
MTNTRDKLNEAKFFLEEMKRVSLDVDKFRYMFTAFLAASRSITQIMQKEYSGIDGFKEWYAKKQEEMKNNGDLKYLLRQRNISSHIRPILPRPIRAIDHLTTGDEMTVVITGTGNINNLVKAVVYTPPIKETISTTYYFEDMLEKGKDVVTVCQEALKAIENIVNECENRVG